jgi:glutamyl-tRNA reductase
LQQMLANIEAGGIDAVSRRHSRQRLHAAQHFRMDLRHDRRAIALILTLVLPPYDEAMQNQEVRFGIVGTGMIAGVVADAMTKSAGARLVAVASRRRENAESFAARFAGAAAVDGTDELLARADIDAEGSR